MSFMSTAQQNKHLPAWMKFSLGLATLGLLFASYTVFHHHEVKEFGHTNLLCNINEVFSCDKVAQSTYSEVSGIPLGVFGVAYFLCLISLLTVSHIFIKIRQKCLSSYSILVVIGLFVCLVLASISIGKIQSLCLACIGIYLVCLSLAFINFRYQARTDAFSPQTSYQGLAISLAIVAVFLAGYKGLFQKDRAFSSKEQHIKISPLSQIKQTIAIATTPYMGKGEDYRLGSDSAPVKIVKFSDFQCPACKGMGTFLKELVRENDNQVQIIYKNFPLDINCNRVLKRPMHVFSCKIAILARCAGQFQKFWQYHDLAFTNQETASAQNAEQWAHEVGLSSSQIKSCLEDESLLAKIKDDIDQAISMDVSATPTVFINGKAFIGQNREELREVISNIISSASVE